MNNDRLKQVKGDRYYGRTARKYEEIRTQQDWWDIEQKYMQELLALIPENLSVVDIPFGTGRFVPYYLDRGFEVFGLDASNEMIAQAMVILGDKMNDVQARTGFSTELPYEDKQFDLLVSTRFLRDIITFSDAKKTLGEFARVTKSYAILQIGYKVTEPYEIPGEDEKMGSRMSYEQTEKLLNEFGFEIMETRLVKGTKDKSSEIHHILCRLS